MTDKMAPTFGIQFSNGQYSNKRTSQPASQPAISTTSHDMFFGRNSDTSDDKQLSRGQHLRRRGAAAGLLAVLLGGGVAAPAMASQSPASAVSSSVSVTRGEVRDAIRTASEMSDSERQDVLQQALDSGWSTPDKLAGYQKAIDEAESAKELQEAIKRPLNDFGKRSGAIKDDNETKVLAKQIIELSQATPTSSQNTDGEGGNPYAGAFWIAVIVGAIWAASKKRGGGGGG